MNTREAYKKGIENASNTYHRKFETLSENMRDSVQKQDKINEQNHKLQKQILDNEERIDRELDNIYEILGEERMPGTLGSAVVMPNTKLSPLSRTF